MTTPLPFWRCCGAVWLLWALSIGHSHAQGSEAQRPLCNLRVGTQTFAGRYQFSTNTLLVETAERIAGLGSDILKFYQGPDYERQYRIPLPKRITNLVALARDEPSSRRVLDMPFRHLLMWVYPFARCSPFDGYSAAEAAAEYRELYDLTAYVLTNYAGSGKTFYFGHWEGDWYLLPNYNALTNPSPIAIQGMIDWLNQRQKAIDDAKRDIPHLGVEVYGYAEVNRVVDAVAGGPNVNQRMINCVIPAVTNLDFVSWSAYDIQDAPEEKLHQALDYITSKLPKAKAGSIPGERVWVGEYGWGVPDSAEQTRRARAFLRRLFRWRTGPRFVLFWQLYNNEPNRAFWLVDEQNREVEAGQFHREFLAGANREVARFLKRWGRCPTEKEFGPLVLPLLEEPLEHDNR